MRCLAHAHSRNEEEGTANVCREIYRINVVFALQEGAEKGEGPWQRRGWRQYLPPTRTNIVCFTGGGRGGGGTMAEEGVPDMTLISDMDEMGINRNLQVRYILQQYAPLVCAVCRIILIVR